MSVFVALFGLAFLILIHEAGHFFVALATGMRPRRFYVGFPPAIAKVNRNGIEYGIGSIPLGGFVKIPGMHRPAPSDLDVHLGRALHEDPGLTGPIERMKRPLAEGDMDGAAVALPELQAAVAAAELSPPALHAAERGLRELADGLGPDAYWRQATAQKVAVIFAGPATNLVAAVVLFAIVFMIGVPTGTTGRVEQVERGWPAAAGGLQQGDRIVALNGRPVDPESISERIQASRGRPLEVGVVRDGERVTLGPIEPRRDTARENVYRLGFALEPEYTTYGPVAAFGKAFEETWIVTEAIGRSLGRLVTGEGREEVSSPVGIVQGSSRALEVGFRYYLQVLGLISLSLALLNMLPLLPLDGGHITFSIIEGLRGRAIGRHVYERMSAIGLAIVLLLFAIGLSNDIGRL
jgi:regulator of sigma E protease